MVMCAFRYNLGRMTYSVHDCAEWLKEIWPVLPFEVHDMIIKEIDEAIVENRSGMPMDTAVWLDLKEFHRDYKATQLEKENNVRRT